MVGLTHSLTAPRDLGKPRSVLDVGCGIRPQQLVKAERYLGIDAHQPYIDALGDPEHFRCSHWQPALAEFADQEFDLVTALDFIEHLERDEGLEFIAEAQRVGKLVVLFTPVGPFPQKFSDPDQWGMDGGFWQTHRSAWTPADFDGWEIYVLPGFAVMDGHMNPLPEPHDAFWALKEA
jgi:SAM-dependent methyltransferase